jgi:hypothetical protein
VQDKVATPPIIDFDTDAYPDAASDADTPQEQNPLDDDEDDCSVADDDLLPRSRDKSDLFHIFQNLPLPIKCHVRALISRLLIPATVTFDAEDFDKVAGHVAKKKGIMAMDALLRDFYFHREWWRRRVRMYVKAAKDHARQIGLIHRLIQDVEPMKSWYTKELQDYLLSFERKCEEGLFKELSDVAMFQWKGTDQNGLDLWLRLRGSTRAENMHQKFSNALGPWGVGAQTGHYLMLLICFRYNVQSRIRRCNGHNFGHPWLQFIDRIQTRIVNIFGADIFPRHSNLEFFQAIDDFIAVGIGPLSYSSEFLEKGAPDT